MMPIFNNNNDKQKQEEEDEEKKDEDHESISRSAHHEWHITLSFFLGPVHKYLVQ